MLDKLTTQIKTLLDGFDEGKMYGMMSKHYRLMQLLDENGQWACPELQEIAAYLLPKDISEHTTKAFVDKVGVIASENPYFLKFIEKAENKSFSRSAQNLATEGYAVIPETVAFAIALDRLVCAMHDNPVIIGKCMEIHKRVRKKVDVFKYATRFDVIKFFSVKVAIEKYLRLFKVGKVDPKFARILLPLNIFEATVQDYLIGNKANAKASIPLIINRTGGKKDPRTGAGPTALADDGKTVLIACPLPLEWNDLYQTWNMAFVTRRPQFPNFLTKLLIPKVADYRNDPQAYMYLRVLALYLTLFHYCMSKLERAKNNEPEIDWRDEKLTALWGEVNFESSLAYKKELARKKQIPKPSVAGVS